MNLQSHQDSIRTTCYLGGVPRLEFPETAALTQSICDRFDEVVNRFPQNVALKSRARSITYSELDSQSNGIAQLLIRKGLSKYERIGLLFEHSALATIAQIGVLKSGSTRVDLNTLFPAERLKQIIEFCKIRFILTRSEHVELAKKLVGEHSFIINLDDNEIPRDGENPSFQLHPNTPATVSYSSGSTGQPKEMIRDHLNELHSIMRVSNSMGIHSQDRMLFTTQTTAIPFHALAHGACYYPTDLRHDGNLVSLIEWLQKERITIFRTPVSTFRALCWSLRDTDEFPDLRLVVLQGEPVFRADVEAFKKRFSDHCVLISTLGVSEFGDFAHYLVDKVTDITTPTVPGGLPLEGIEVVLLKAENTENENSCEIGIRGSVISHSTSSRIALLSEVGSADRVPTFATGDTGQIDSDGCIYHTGRKDLQVKIRGNRVDLLAVEAALLDLDGISQVAVVGHTETNGDVSLVAYIESPSIDATGIQKQLRAILPDYMVPTIFMGLEKLPRTLTGKIDRNSLPAPEVNLQSSLKEVGAGDVQDLSETSKEIMAIWKEVLQLDQIGVDDNFLAIGGDSLKAMRVLARINQSFDINLKLRSLFDSGTIGLLADTVDSLLSADS